MENIEKDEKDVYNFQPPSHNIGLTDLLVLFISVLVHRLRILSDLHRDELLALKRASGPQAEAF